MVKVYLGLQRGFVDIEVDLHEVSHHINIVRGHFVETVKDIYAPYNAIHLFFMIFPNAQLLFLY